MSSMDYAGPDRRRGTAARVGEKTTIGGFAPKALKKLNGARLMTPPDDSVVTHAIGRGLTTPVM